MSSLLIASPSSLRNETRVQQQSRTSTLASTEFEILVLVLVVEMVEVEGTRTLRWITFGLLLLSGESFRHQSVVRSAYMRPLRLVADLFLPRFLSYLSFIAQAIRLQPKSSSLSYSSPAILLRRERLPAATTSSGRPTPSGPCSKPFSTRSASSFHAYAFSLPRTVHDVEPNYIRRRRSFDSSHDDASDSASTDDRRSEQSS